ncbi:MAG: hypothetical protein ABI599_15560 [Flavobacteriales bacterium]
MKRGALFLSLTVLSFISMRWWGYYRIKQIAAQTQAESETAMQLEQLDNLYLIKLIAALCISTCFFGIALYTLLKRKQESIWAYGILSVIAVYWLS